MSTTQSIVQALRAFTACDVADALLKLKVPHGGFLAGLTLWSPERQAGAHRVVGPAYTVKYVRKGDGGEGENDKKVKGHYIDQIPRGAVVFISSPPKTINAVYGGLMSTRAKYSGAAGTVVDGRIRDLQEHRDLEYPVFARDVGTTAPHEVVKVSEINTPVRLQSEDQEAVIHPGDFIIGDLNGVVCLPKDLAENALELMGSQVEADEKIAADIKAGKGFAEASKVHRAGVKQP